MASLQRRLLPYFLVAPGVLLLLLLFVVPLVRMLQVSFLTQFPGPAAFTLSHYAELLTDGYFLGILLRTLRVALLVTLGSAVLGYPVAYYFVHGNTKLKGLIFFGIVSPLLTSVVVRTLGWLLILGREGLVNAVLVAVHVRTEPRSFLSTEGAVLVGMIHVLLPFMILSIVSVLNSIDPALEEAAKITGASPARAFYHVTLPLSLQGVAAGAALVFSVTVGSYVTPFFLGGGKVHLLATRIYDLALGSVNWPMAAAVSMVLLVLGTFAAFGYMAFIERVGGGER